MVAIARTIFGDLVLDGSDAFGNTNPTAIADRDSKGAEMTSEPKMTAEEIATEDATIEKLRAANACENSACSLTFRHYEDCSYPCKCDCGPEDGCGRNGFHYANCFDTGKNHK